MLKGKGLLLVLVLQTEMGVLGGRERGGAEGSVLAARIIGRIWVFDIRCNASSGRVILGR